MMNTDELRESLLMASKNGYARISPEEREEMNAYCRRYMDFMDACKTEREATAWAVREAEKRGFKPFTPGMEAKPGDKIYYNKTLLISPLPSPSCPTIPQPSA